MAIWTVFSQAVAGDTAAKAAERVAFVPEKFSWTTLFFAPIALAYHRLWLALGAYVALSILLGALSAHDLLSEEAAGLVMFGVQIVYAFELPAMRANKLLRRGYDPEGVVVARTRDEAEHRFFTSWAGKGPARPAPLPLVRPAGPGRTESIAGTGVIGSLGA